MPLRAWLILPLFILGACRNNENPGGDTNKVILVSYTHDVRPIFATNCIKCHSAASTETIFHLSLAEPHIPDTFAFPHPHKPQLTPKDQATIIRWIDQGQQIDPHWSTNAIPKEFPLDQIDAFLPPGNKRTSPRPAPDLSHAITTPKNLPALLAGDFLKNPLPTQFLRRSPDTPAYRLHTTAEQFLGLNLECAQCHNHPTDSITRDDYLHLTKLFTTPYDDADRPKNPLRPPTLITPALQDSKIPEITAALQARTTTGQTHYQAWLADKDRIPHIPDLFQTYSFNGGRLTNLAIHSRATAAPIKIPQVPGIHREAALLGNKAPLSLPSPRPGAFTFSFWITASGSDAQLLFLGQAPIGFDLHIRNGHLEARLTRYWPGNAIGMRSTTPVALQDTWQHLAVTYDGSRTPSGIKLFLNGSPLPIRETGTTLTGQIFTKSASLTLGGPATTPWHMDEFSHYLRALTPIEIRHLTNSRALLQETPTPDYYFSALDPESRTLRMNLIAHRWENKRQETPVMEAIAVTPRETTNPLAHALTADTRLEFAQNLTSKDRNLLTRAIANHLWKLHFGQALVPHGFGYGGPAPKNLDLLNWLSQQLIDSDWDLQKISALIQNSHLYRSDYPEQKEDGLVCPRPILVKPKIRY